MSDDTPPGFDDNPDNVIAMRHPESGAPIVIPRELALKESRHYQAYCDYVGGESWEVIAERYEYPDARAAQYDIKTYIEGARSLYNSLTRHQAKALMMARLETLMNAAWPAATKGNLPAINAARQLVVDMVKLGKLDELPDEEAETGARTVIIEGDESSYVSELERVADRD